MAARKTYTLTNPPTVKDIQSDTFAEFAKAQHKKMITAHAKELANIAMIALAEAGQKGTNVPVQLNVGGINMLYCQNPEGHYKVAMEANKFDPEAVNRVCEKFKKTFENTQIIHKPSNWKNGLQGTILSIES